jgi:hypothetical protein
MKRLLLMVALSLAAAPLFAAGPVVPAGLRACKAMQDSLQRLLCYDTQVAELDNEVAQVKPETTPEAPVSSPQFGQESLARKARPVADSEPSSLTSKVTGLRPVDVGISLITLENGQVWRQQEPARDFYANVGDTVRIEKGVLGSFRLVKEGRGGGRWVRVARLK